MQSFFELLNGDHVVGVCVEGLEEGLSFLDALVVGADGDELCLFLSVATAHLIYMG